MARTGFTAIWSGQITFGRDGRWYCDGEVIANAAICRLYASAMTIGDDGIARLALGEDRATVHIEDTPWVVVRIDGDPAQGFRVVLNDGTDEALDPATLEIGAANVLYCRARHGTHRVRFLRPAYYDLMRHVGLDADGQAVLTVAGRPTRLAQGGT